MKVVISWFFYETLDLKIDITGFVLTAWKVPKYGVISGPHFPVFSRNTGKYGPETTTYLDIFHEVTITMWLNHLPMCFIIYRYSNLQQLSGKEPDVKKYSNNSVSWPQIALCFPIGNV